MQINAKLTVSALCCLGLAMATTPALADTRASSFLPLAQKSAVAGCAASRAAAELAVQGAPTQGCIFPLKPSPPPIAEVPAPATPSAPAAPSAPVPPAAPVTPAVGGGLGWASVLLGGLAAIVGSIFLFDGGSEDGNGVSPG